MSIGKSLSVQAFDYVQAAFNRYHNHQISACITLEGRVQIEVLEHALNLTMKELPQLACRFYNGEYERLTSRQYVELITVESVEKAVDQIFGETIELANSHQVRVVVLRKKENDTIVIVMSHLLCDGTAMKQYLYLLCQYYNALLEHRKVKHLYQGKERGIRWVRKCDLPTKKRRRKKKECLPISSGDQKVFAKYLITKEEYQQIREYTKKNKVTINDLFMAVYYKAIWEVFQYPLSSLCCAVDLRRYKKDKEEIGLCNQTGNAFTTIRNVKEMEFSLLLQKVHRQMRFEKEQGFCLKQIKQLEVVFSKLPHWISRRVIRATITNPQVAITNLGQIEKEKLQFKGTKTIACYLSPSLKWAPNFQLAVSTFDQQIMLEVNMVVSKKGEKKIREFLERYHELTVKNSK